ncbi:hypothetical protein BX600DRAFT_433066 [Xylariales sp. PMI_506]|nr:hypothetical protein BX600DRAFT_433066 [Xylariales sp. PMI_506]
MNFLQPSSEPVPGADHKIPKPMNNNGSSQPAYHEFLDNFKITKPVSGFTFSCFAKIHHAALPDSFVNSERYGGFSGQCFIDKASLTSPEIAAGLDACNTYQNPFENNGKFAQGLMNMKLRFLIHLLSFDFVFSLSAYSLIDMRSSLQSCCPVYLTHITPG